MNLLFDLGIIMTIASSLKDIPIDPKIFMFGEVGLSGEMRPLTCGRLKETAKIGFKKALMSGTNSERLEIFGLE